MEQLMDANGEEKGKKRNHVSKACENCKRSHLSCDSVRPCSRCKARNKECLDVQSKRRGRKMQNFAEAVESPPDPLLATNLVDNAQPEWVARSALSGYTPPAPILAAEAVFDLTTNLFARHPQPIQRPATADVYQNPLPPVPEEFLDLSPEPLPLDVLGDLFLFSPFENMETVGRTKYHSRPADPNAEKNETPSTFSRLDMFAKLEAMLRKRIPEKVPLFNIIKALRPRLVALREGLTPEVVVDIMKAFDSYLATFSQLFDQLGSPFVIWERCGVIHHVNKAFVEITGFNTPMPTLLDDFAFPSLLSNEGLRGYFDGLITVFLSFGGGMPPRDTYMFRTGIKVANNPEFIEGMMCVTVKRDLLGLPLIFFGNFLPCNKSS